MSSVVTSENVITPFFITIPPLASDNYKVTVQYNWKMTDTNYLSPDYTVRFYSPTAITVKNSKDLTSVINMDGNQPSGFTKSTVNINTASSVSDQP